MDIKFHKSSRGIWIFYDGKHRKTVPAKYEQYIVENITKFDFTKKYCTPAEIEMLQLLSSERVIAIYLEKIKTTEPNLYRLIKDVQITGVRFVESCNGNTRHELCFSNNLKIKCPYSVFAAYPIKLEPANLNY